MAGRRAPRRILITLLVLVVLLIAADRIGDAVAENVAASELQKSQKLAAKPDVDIAGFPFLTQFASGKYDQITVTAKNVRVGNGSVQVDLEQVRVVFGDITVSRDFRSYRAARANAVATVGYARLSSALGVDLGYAGSGEVKIGKLGLSVTVRPQLVDGALSFAANRLLQDALPLANIPFDVRVRQLSATPDGLRLDLDGSNLSYTAN